MKKHKIKKRYFIPVLVITILFIVAVLYFQFTPMGYRMTVRYRNFTEIQNNIYVENNYIGDTDKIISLIKVARSRNSEFWGSTESEPIIIISDNAKTLEKLGGDHDTLTAVFFKVKSYISISSEYLNVDILAHEMTHAELHARLYKGKLPQTLVPTWFDEGVAIQNDYREQYNDEAWHEKTDNGSYLIELNNMDTPEEFYGGSSDDRRFRYLISRYELKTWIKKNGMDSLIQLIREINAGEDFYELYYKTNK